MGQQYAVGKTQSRKLGQYANVVWAGSLRSGVTAYIFAHIDWQACVAVQHGMTSSVQSIAHLMHQCCAHKAHTLGADCGCLIQPQGHMSGAVYE